MHLKIRCVCLVRDEADIVGETLARALEWADHIYVQDNGSTDGTRDLLRSHANREPRLTLLPPESRPFRDSLRGEATNLVLSQADAGDWWCRLDADEIYVDEPRGFLARVPRRHSVVYSASLQYYFTDRDLLDYQREPEEYVRTWTPESMHYYLGNWSEPRFVRHAPGVRWSGAWPANFGKLRAHPARIRLRHYQYRTPPQIARRLRIRASAELGSTFAHEVRERWVPGGLAPEDIPFPGGGPDGAAWRTRIVRAESLDCDDGGELRVREELLPPIRQPAGFLERLLVRVNRKVRRFSV